MPTTLPRPLPSEYVATRAALHRVAVHVVARRRDAVSGRFGLRATPGGFGTPLFGDPDHEEVVRVSGGLLVRESRDAAGPRTAVVPLDGSSLARLATAVGVDLTPGFTVGTDTPEVGDVDTPLRVAVDAVAVMGDFLAVGAAALDRVLAQLGPDAAPIVAQLWPEHFDLGLDVAGGTSRVNLGASLGDHFHEAPYVYVGPWGAERPGDPAYWNVAFGALLGYDALAASADPVATVAEFLHRGLGLLAA